jgi:hypothetical protein
MGSRLPLCELHVLTSASRRTCLGIVLIAIAERGARAQQLPPLRDVPKPTREIADPFSFVTSLAEARAGKVVVADGVEAELSVVDFATGTRTKLGRQGAGPGEYRAPGTVMRLRGDTVWVLDGGQSRIAAFSPELTPQAPVVFVTFDAQTRSQLIAPFFGDRQGRVYASGLAVGANGANMQMPDSVDLMRVDPRVDGSRASLARLRFPTSGKPDMQVQGTVIRYTMAYPGLVASDVWAAFPDGRVAIAHGGNCTIEFIGADGRRTTTAPIPYDRIAVAEADKAAEMEEAKRRMKDQTRAAQRSMPAGMTLDIVMNPPASWPAEYPALSPIGAHAAADGRLWLRRATPARAGRERWDVIDASGKLVARWQLPPKTSLVGLGDGGVIYTVRVDEDDLRYLQRIELPR